ncbi:MAG TPA: DUF839 domain-containing protein, partial [Myxococcota bacterium]|nr:DUF839 domain-containing protein [Myxococcota bacterium]
MRRSLTVALLCACGSPQPAAPPPARPEIDGLAPPLDDADKAIVRTAPAVTVGGVSTPLRYQVLARSGEPIAGVPYGAILDVTGHPVLGDDGAPVDCGGADFTGLVQAHGALFLTQHIECTPSAIYVTRLAQDPDGALRAVTTAPVDEAPVGGGVNHCAGQITPWGTHLGSEEYEPDARRIGADGALPSDDEGWHLMARYLGKPLSEVDPYDYGWLPELTITSAEGSTSIVKHRAMGRFSHELGLVLPDERTVYLSDDGSGGALFLFIADAPRDLSAGALFAARWQQTSDAEATLAW